MDRDPIGYGGNTLNLYEYVGSKPTGYVDPMGLKKYKCTMPLYYFGSLGVTGGHFRNF